VFSLKTPALLKYENLKINVETKLLDNKENLNEGRIAN